MGWPKTQVMLMGTVASLMACGGAPPAAEEPRHIEPPADSAGDDQLQVAIEGSSLVLMDGGGQTPLLVFFEVDSDSIDPDHHAALDALATFMNNHNERLRIEVQGHADERGTDAYNDDLSHRRAEAVKEYLVARGVDSNRLDAAGYGERHPLAESDESRNRRVEFVLDSEAQELTDATDVSP